MNYPVRTTNGLRQSSIAARHEYVLAHIQAEMSASTAADLQQKYKVGHRTVENWEVYYRCKVRRWCQMHRGYVPGDQMVRGVVGRKLQRCHKCNAERPLEPSGAGFGDVEINMPATPGKLFYWIQPNGYTHSGVGQEVLAVSEESQAA